MTDVQLSSGQVKRFVRVESPSVDLLFRRFFSLKPTEKSITTTVLFSNRSEYDRETKLIVPLPIASNYAAV